MTSEYRVENESIHDLLSKASERLGQAGIDTPILDAQVLLSHASGLSRTVLAAHPETVPAHDQVAQFRGWVALRLKRMPLAYIVGSREFYGLEFDVGSAVLIPRPETETLVEATIGLLSDRPCTIADLGVGSGAIAVSLAASLPESHICGTDCSKEALEIARRNAKKHGVGPRVDLRNGDLLEPLYGLAFDAVVSNPPYIRSDEIPRLEPEVALYEPHGALDGGPDGLDYYRRIVPDARRHLRPGGFLAVEVGAGQSSQISDLFRENGYIDVRAVRDLAGIERVVLGHV